MSKLSHSNPQLDNVLGQHTQHTPGPWKAICDKNDFHWYAVRDLRHSYVYVAKIEHQSEDSEADARLIAAAPELLAALEVACSYLDFVDGKNESTQKQIAFWNSLIANARGTI